MEGQLDALKKACKGKRWLVVLDDVWSPKHEKALNCVDEESPSKLFVTTRIRGLLKGCDEVSLELLTPAEAVELLLLSGNVEADDAAREAASKIAELCSYLPLYVSICGGVICDYHGSSDWQTELVEMLKEDRLEVMGAAEDNNVSNVVGTSLTMLKDDVAEAVFQMLSLCPEDDACCPACPDCPACPAGAGPAGAGAPPLHSKPGLQTRPSPRSCMNAIARTWDKQCVGARTPQRHSLVTK